MSSDETCTSVVTRGSIGDTREAAELESPSAPVGDSDRTGDSLGTAGKRRAALWNECSSLAQEPDILVRVCEGMSRVGFVGDFEIPKILYLALTSRFQQRPLSLLIGGPSSAGKSFVVASVLRLFPQTAYIEMTGMSPKALAYGEEPLSHRMLILAEAAGLNSGFATYLVRSLLSERRIRYETVLGGKNIVINREGPTGLILTSTALSIDPELATRLFSVSANDTTEQTKNVMLAQARQAEGEVRGDGAGILAEFRALQEWLGVSKHHDVVVPFAGALAEKVHPLAIRLRRDFESVLTLIQTHAFLHQAKRETDGLGRIVATRADYVRVYDLVHEIVGDAVEASVTETLRETVQAVNALASSGAVTIVAVARRLGVDKAAAWRRVKVAMDRGYVRNLEARKGRPAMLTKGEPLPEEVAVLPTPEELFG